MNHSTSLSFPFSWGKSAPQTTEVAQLAPEAAKPAASEENPFRSSDPVPTANATNPAAPIQQVSASTPAASGAGSTPAPRFDAATMMLIETEFKDASAEERRQWFEELRQVPPEMVPRILRMRRLTQQALAPKPAESRPAGEPQNALIAAQNHGQPATAMQTTTMQIQPQISPTIPASANHLQALTPWENQAATGIAVTPQQGTGTTLAGGSPVILSAGQPDISLSQQQVTLTNNVAASGQSLPAHAVPGQSLPAHAAPGQIMPGQTVPGSSTVPGSLAVPGSPTMPTGQPLLTTTSTPVDTTNSADNYQETLERLIALTEQRIAGQKPGTLEEERLAYTTQHAFLRMLYLMANRQERALEAIPQLPTSEQEFWQQMFWAMSSYFDSTGIPNPADRSTHTISLLTEATTRLREQANLELRNLAFCKKIDGFGIYERFDRDEFRPGQPVLVYAEMRNFLSEPTNDGQYKTILKSTIEIHRAGSQSGLVTRQDFTPTEDHCRNRRHDYFHSYMINIPERVTVGPHVLKLIVEDQLNRKVASYSINFTVH